MGHNSQRYAVGSIEPRQRNRANSGLGLVAQVVSVRARASHTITPASSTMHTAVSSNDTSNPAK
jgi:hypothetical protein